MSSGSGDDQKAAIAKSTPLGGTPLGGTPLGGTPPGGTPTSGSERLLQMKERSKLRRELLAKQMGVKDTSMLASVLGGQHVNAKEANRLDMSNWKDPTAKKPKADEKSPRSDPEERDGDDGGAASDDADVVYHDSQTFLKGTQSLNPHNDYSQNFVDSGRRAQNFIRDTGITDRFDEYPKLKELIRLKDEIILRRATPPMYLQCDLDSFYLSELVPHSFDVIYIDPPLEEYQRRCPGLTFTWRPWQWEEIRRLEIGRVISQRGFCFLWCGAMEGLDEGRRCLKEWGFRRCEDICWIKTNKTNPGNTKFMEPLSVLQHTKEHCLMGIRGTVRRSVDGDFIHANVDLDIIIGEEPEYGSTDKPEEMFRIVEHFCLGRRRLNVFGNDHTIRPGWLTVGPALSSSNYSRELYDSYFAGGPEELLVGNTDQIETLRPKSPPAKKGGAGGAGRGRGGARHYSPKP